MPLPGFTANPGQRRATTSTPDIFMNQAYSRCRNVNPRTTSKFNLQMFFNLVVTVQLFQAPVTPNPVCLMDYQVTNAELRKAVDRFSHLAPRRWPAQLATGK